MCNKFSPSNIYSSDHVAWYATVEQILLINLQATIAPPVKEKMFKGLCICYAIVAMIFFSVAISGYWAFGKPSWWPHPQ